MNNIETNLQTIKNLKTESKRINSQINRLENLLSILTKELTSEINILKKEHSKYINEIGVFKAELPPEYVKKI